MNELKKYIYDIFRIRYVNDINLSKAFDYFFDNCQAKKAVHRGYPEADWNKLHDLFDGVDSSDAYRYFCKLFSNNTEKYDELNMHFENGNKRMFEEVLNKLI